MAPLISQYLQTPHQAWIRYRALRSLVLVRKA